MAATRVPSVKRRTDARFFLHGVLFCFPTQFLLSLLLHANLFIPDRARSYIRHAVMRLVY